VPVRYQIDQNHSLVRLDLSDPLDSEQVVETVNRLLSDPALCRGLNFVSDHSKLDSTATTELVKSIPELLTKLTERLGPFRCAVVVPGDASYGMARMAEVFAERTSAAVRAFRTLDEAEAWSESLNGRTHR
jgi:23S rRNA U2552 (ribose-2'-O)-methylase RlmE/FtsJ